MTQLEGRQSQPIPPGQAALIVIDITKDSLLPPEVSGIDLNHDDKDWSDWYSQREFRDNRTVLFLNGFGGKAQFQYAMRVQVPGQFRVAPARVERMYEPDVRANSASAAMAILDK